MYILLWTYFLFHLMYYIINSFYCIVFHLSILFCDSEVSILWTKQLLIIPIVFTITLSIYYLSIQSCIQSCFMILSVYYHSRFPPLVTTTRISYSSLALHYNTTNQDSQQVTQVVLYYKKNYGNHKRTQQGVLIYFYTLYKFYSKFHVKSIILEQLYQS